MTKAFLAAALVFVLVQVPATSFAAARFERMSDHCYCFQSTEGGGNVGAVVTDEGVVIIDPPPEPALSAAAEALKKLTSKDVRWAVFTSPSRIGEENARYYSGQGAVLVASAQLYGLYASSNGDSKAAGPEARGGNPAKLQDASWFIFDRQMRLFPANLEVRIVALQPKSRTGGDVFVFVPAEKVLFVGGLYEPARYPDIDVALGGNADGWIEGLSQVVDSVPLLKAAIPAAKPLPKSAPKPAAKPEKKPAAKPEEAEDDEEKALEESFAIVSVSGNASNLREMKDMLQTSRKLRNDIARSARTGGSCENFLASSRSGAYRNFANLDSYACRLFEALRRK